MRIEEELKLNFDDVLIKPKRSTLKSRADVDLTRTFNFVHSKRTWSGIPIIATNMDTVGTIKAAEVMERHQMLTWLHKFYSLEEISNLMTVTLNGFAVTIGEEKPIPNLNFLSLPFYKFVRIDVANGYRQSFVDYVKEVRQNYPQIVIFAGNVCTPEQTEELILAGADIVVVGIGGGSHCITRSKTGIGYPQLSAVIECADAAHGLGGHIVSDGGCKSPADVVKAFAAGADFVALGGMLAGHDENTLEENIIYEEHTGPNCNGSISVPIKAKVYGMSSKEAMDKYYGGVADHRTAEGSCTWISYKGPLENTLKDILGSLRSACTYVGAKRLKELTKRTTFIKVRSIK